MKQLYKNDFEGLYLRKNQFTGTVPFDEAKIQEYHKVVRYYAAKVYRYNKYVFHKVGMDEEDIVAIGYSFVYTFFITNKMVFKNKKHESAVLQRHLRQRNETLILFTKRKAQGILESDNYENYNYFSMYDDNRHIEEVLCADATPSVEEALISESTKNQLRVKIERYIKGVEKVSSVANALSLKELNITTDQHRKICLHYITNFFKTESAFIEADLLRGKYGQIASRIGSMLKRNAKKGLPSKALLDLMNMELDFNV